MMITYITMEETISSVAKLRPYGSASQWSEFSGISVKFVDGGSEKSVRFVHRVKLSGLVPAARYEYMVGDDKGGWSSTYSFNAMRSMENKTKDKRPWRFICLADMGLENDRTLENITELVRTSAGAQTPYDGVLLCRRFGLRFSRKARDCWGRFYGSN